MALQHQLRWKTSREMFEAITAVYARYEPRDPVPAWWMLAHPPKYPEAHEVPPSWWSAFAAFFAKHPDGCVLRTEPFEATDEE
jgi:hypothetical protein